MGPLDPAGGGAEVLRHLARRPAKSRGGANLSAPPSARQRVQRFLAGGDADRPPFVAQATEYAARMAQSSVSELIADPNLFVRAAQEMVAVSGLDALAFEIAPEWVAPVAGGEAPSAAEVLEQVREDLHRLRATMQDRVALVTLLPGPLTLCEALGEAATPDAMDDMVAALLRVQEHLDPPSLDGVGVFERRAVGEEEEAGLGGALSALWNVARYYSLPSLLVAAGGGPGLGSSGATTVAVWEGTSPPAILARGARAVGVPVDDPGGLPEIPEHGFPMTKGEIPPTWEVGAVRSLVRRATAPPT